MRSGRRGLAWRKRAAQSTGGVLFADDFSSGDLSKTQNGFTWGANTWSAVESQPSIARTGTNVLRFAMGGPVPDRVAELRFDLGAEYPEVWFRYYVYFPTGAESTNVGPRAVGGNTYGAPDGFGRANKILRLFPRGDGNGDPRFGAQFVQDGIGGDKWSSWAGLSRGLGQTSPLATDGTQTNGLNTAAEANWITDAVRGTWVKTEFRAKPSTNDTAPNGEFQVWFNDVSVSNVSNIDAYYPSRNIGGGYLFGAQDTGWINSGTKVYVADFAVSVTGRIP